MKGCIVAIDTINGRRAAAQIIDGKLNDFLMDAGDDTPLPGAIYRAVCDRPMKGQGGMFLTLEKGVKGFLRQAKGLAPGDSFLVQVTGYAEEGKAVPVTAKVLFKSRYVIITPGAPGFNVARSIRDDDERERLLEIAHACFSDVDGFGMILRSACFGVDAEELEEDLLATVETAQAVMADEGQGPELLLEGADAHELAWRDWSEPKPDEILEGGFDQADVFDLIEQAKGALVPLGSANAYIEPTRALVAVDVNTGADTSPAAGLKANIAMAKELPRALRVRGLAGQIVLDLAPMAKKDRRQFETVLRSALRGDSIETSLVGWTPLGHFELSRKRERRPLADLLARR